MDIAETNSTPLTSWRDFLQQQGATLGPGPEAEVTGFAETPADYPRLRRQTLLFSLDDRGLIACGGPDTDKLLQGQLTCDIRQLSETHPLAGALCDVKGRMISNFRLCKAAGGDTLMITHRGLVVKTLETLGKFAVFYKTTPRDDSDQYRLLGLSGPEADPLVAEISGVSVQPDTQGLQGTGLTALRLDSERWLLVAAAEGAESLWSSLARGATPAGLPLWRLLAIAAGEGEVLPQTSGEFIPQMLNLQHTGAVNFKKGCYTGQEIVARMQYLGKLKRRMYRLAIDGPAPPPGTPLHLPGGQECGAVVDAAPRDGDTWEMLAVLTEPAASGQQLLAEGKPVSVTLLPLPYDLQFEKA